MLFDVILMHLMLFVILVNGILCYLMFLSTLTHRVPEVCSKYTPEFTPKYTPEYTFSYEGPRSTNAVSRFDLKENLKAERCAVPPFESRLSACVRLVRTQARHLSSNGGDGAKT